MLKPRVQRKPGKLICTPPMIGRTRPCERQAAGLGLGRHGEGDRLRLLHHHRVGRETQPRERGPHPADRAALRSHRDPVERLVRIHVDRAGDVQGLRRDPGMPALELVPAVRRRAGLNPRRPPRRAVGDRGPGPAPPGRGPPEWSGTWSACPGHRRRSPPKPGTERARALASLRCPWAGAGEVSGEVGCGGLALIGTRGQGEEPGQRRKLQEIALTHWRSASRM